MKSLEYRKKESTVGVHRKVKKNRKIFASKARYLEALVELDAYDHLALTATQEPVTRDNVRLAVLRLRTKFAKPQTKAVEEHPFPAVIK